MLLDHKAGGLKMLKKEPVEYLCHGAASPPVIDDLDNRVVILDLYLSQDTHHCCSSAKEKASISLQDTLSLQLYHLSGLAISATFR
jgi:hypothetical protein